MNPGNLSVQEEMLLLVEKSAMGYEVTVTSEMLKDWAERLSVEYEELVALLD